MIDRGLLPEDETAWLLEIGRRLRAPLLKSPYPNGSPHWSHSLRHENNAKAQRTYARLPIKPWA